MNVIIHRLFRSFDRVNLRQTATIALSSVLVALNGRSTGSANNIEMEIRSREIHSAKLLLWEVNGVMHMMEMKIGVTILR